MLDRVKELRRVPASELLANPRNWRTHPAAQHEALRGVLSEIGFAGAVVARELEDGTLELIDGHLRAETAADAQVPVLVVDLDEQEAAKLLLTFDSISAMAGVDAPNLTNLLDDVTTDSPAVERLLEELRMTIDPEPERKRPDRPEVDIPESYQVVVECPSETEQQDVYEQMRAAGYQCRVLTL